MTEEEQKQKVLDTFNKGLLYETQSITKGNTHAEILVKVTDEQTAESAHRVPYFYFVLLPDGKYDSLKHYLSV